MDSFLNSLTLEPFAKAVERMTTAVDVTSKQESMTTAVDVTETKNDRICGWTETTRSKLDPGTPDSKETTRDTV